LRPRNSKKIVIFPDTNLFLQYKDLKELKWDEITDAQEICLLISRGVQKEIDEHKRSESRRRAKRAKKTYSLFREVLQHPNDRLVIIESSPRLELTLSRITIEKELINCSLDLDHPDDQLVGEAIQYLHENSEVNVLVLSNDTRPISSAKHCGVPCKFIPDSWLLAPEPDEQDKKINELERKIKELKNEYPQIKLSCENVDGNVIDSISMKVLTYDDLNDDQYDEIISVVTKTYPLVEDLSELSKSISVPELTREQRFFGSKYIFRRPSEKAINDYRERYEKWLVDIKATFSGLRKNLNEQSRKVDLLISLGNNGSVPALNLVIEFIGYGEFLIKYGNDLKSLDKDIKLPHPPKAPRGSWELVHRSGSLLEIAHAGQLFAHASQLFSERYGSSAKVSLAYPNSSIMSDISKYQGIAQRDRHAFYLKDDEVNLHRSILSCECAEFRHKVEEEVFRIQLVTPSDKKISNGAFKCRVTASNLPNPVELTIPITVSYIEQDFAIEAWKLIDRLIDKT